jgi:hypothetical protein
MWMLEIASALALLGLCWGTALAHGFPTAVAKQKGGVAASSKPISEDPARQRCPSRRACHGGESVYGVTCHTLSHVTPAELFIMARSVSGLAAVDGPRGHA